MAKKFDVTEVISRCQAAVLALYGEEITAKSEVYYDRGWFYVAIARVFPDGSVGKGGKLPDSHRYTAMMVLIEEMESRAAKKNASAEAGGETPLP